MHKNVICSHPGLKLLCIFLNIYVSNLKQNFYSISDGKWGNWAAWESCNATCGGGTQARTRTCSNPAPNYGSAACVGLAMEKQNCSTQKCPIGKPLCCIQCKYLNRDIDTIFLTFLDFLNCKNDLMFIFRWKLGRVGCLGCMHC